MKRVIIVYEGAAEEPLAELGGRTPLQVARGKQSSALAAAGATGLLEPLREDLPWRSEALLGALCRLHRDDASRLRRGPVEGAALGAPMPEAGTWYRGTFVTVDEGEVREEAVAGLGLEETRALCEAVAASRPDAGVSLHVLGPGAVSVHVPHTGPDWPEGLPPRLARGRRLHDLLPGGGEAGGFASFVSGMLEALAAHPVNEVRVDLGENPANALWLWGGGTADALASLRACPQTRGLVLSRGRVARAVAGLTRMDYLEHEDPFAEDRDGPLLPVGALVEALRSHDLVLVHVPSPLEMGGYGGPSRKVRALDRLDIHLLMPFKTVLDAYRPYRLAVIPDGAVSSVTGLPLPASLPVLIAGEGIEPDESERWDEAACAQGGLGSMDIEHFLEILWGT
jgi:2,3-bisphosphoglycerate-independent phosphoglycerate mutase